MVRSPTAALVLLAFCGLAVASEPTPPYELSPDQVRAAVERLKAGRVPPQVMDQLRQRLADQFGAGATSPEVRDAVRRLTADPALMQQLRMLAEWQTATGQVTDPADLERLFNRLPKPPVSTPRPTNDPATPQLPPLGMAPNPPGTPNPVPMPLPGPLPPIDLRSMATDPGPPGGPDATGRERVMRAVAAFWERNVGPLRDTPALQRALAELVAAGEGLRDDRGESLWSALEDAAGDGSSLAEWLDGASVGGWKLPSLDLPSIDWNWGGSPAAAAPATGGGWWPSRPEVGNGGGWWRPVLAGALLVVAGAVAWRWWPRGNGEAPASGQAFELGGWPIDPRSVVDRAGLVTAFEYLTVLRCGPAARTWNHDTIGTSLGDLTAESETAAALARAYALARYTPAGDTLPPAALADARRCLLRLAGVPPA